MIQQNNSYRIAICDDDRQDIEHINEMVHKILQDENIESDIFCYNSGSEIIEAMQNGISFDLILLDVVMPNKDGMELASYLRDNLYENDIVFISVNREMALRGYEVAARRYLAKPINLECLREAILFCYGSKQKSEILIPVNGGVRKVRYDEIKYIETQGRGCKISLETGEIFTSLLISKLQSICSNNNFERCHQGFIVNFRFVRELTGSEFVLAGGECIPISKHRLKQVRKEFISYLSNQ